MVYAGTFNFFRKNPRAVLNLYYSNLNYDISYLKYLLVLSSILGNILHSRKD